MITATLITSSGTVYADEAPAAASRLESYELTDKLQVQLKSLLNEKTADGVRLGAVVRMTNVSGSITRVPEYELRVKTADGVEYTLTPSSTNAKSVQPKATIELSYLSVVDRSDELALSELSWVDVDEYVYPKKETNVLTLPVASRSWQGSDAAIDDPAAIKKWGESFTLDYEDSPLVYSAVDLTETTNGQGPVNVVKVLVQNPGTKKEAVPDFAIDGKTEQQTFAGQRVEQGTIYIEPGEKKYIHFAIPTTAGAKLASLNVVTTESFRQANPQGQVTTVNYSVGRLKILLPPDIAGTELAMLPKYNFGDAIAFDPVSKLIDPKMTVSLMDLRIYQNEGKGYKTAVARFKLDNKSENPLPIPALGAELDSSNGFRYAGSKLSAGSAATGAGMSASAGGIGAGMTGAGGAGGVGAGVAGAGGAAQSSAGASAAQLMPNSSGIVAYSFLLPESEDGDFALKLLDTAVAAPYPSTVAAFKPAMLPELPSTTPTALSFYPFEVTIKDWDYHGSISTMGYSYLVKLDLDIQLKDDVVIGQDVPKLEVELVDRNGTEMASQALSFVGKGRLVDGPQTITFNNVGSQLEGGVKINIYETIDTANGPVKRLVAYYQT